MASRALPDDELERLATWPPEVSRADLVAHFTLSLDDARWARSFRSPSARADRLGLGVQLCALRFLGFVPADLVATPGEVVQRLADQLGAPAGGLSRYADQVSGRSRREHVALVVVRAGWRACGRGEWKALGDWLVAWGAGARHRRLRAVRFGPPSSTCAPSTWSVLVWTGSCERWRLQGPTRPKRSIAGSARPLAQSVVHNWTPWSTPTLNWLPPTPIGKGPCRVRETAADGACPALVHRRSFPPAHRAPAQPGRGPERPPPFHLLRPPRRRPLFPHDDQTTQAHCQTLVVNACIYSTTCYLALHS